MKNRKFYTACFTCNRPNWLPWKYDETDHRFLELKIKLQHIIVDAMSKGYKYFICGMALGVDLLCAEIVLRVRKWFHGIKLECAIPCKNQAEKWRSKDLDRYGKILLFADKITYVSDSDYYDGCMQKRNKYMVDKSDLLIAVHNGLPGGTKQTLDYAISKGIQVKVVDPYNLKDIFSPWQNFLIAVP